MEEISKGWWKVQDDGQKIDRHNLSSSFVEILLSDKRERTKEKRRPNREIKKERTKGKNITDKSKKLRSLPYSIKHNTPNQHLYISTRG